MNLIVQIIECSKKYMQKFRKLDEKYNVNQNNKQTNYMNVNSLL